MFGLDACRTKIVSIYAQTIHIGGKLEASTYMDLDLTRASAVYYASGEI